MSFRKGFFSKARGATRGLRGIVSIAIVAAVGLLAFNTKAFAVTNAFPNTDEGIHVGVMSYSILQNTLTKYPEIDIKNKVDYIWSSPDLRANANFETTHAGRYATPLWLDAGFSAIPTGDHDLAWFEANHPDWIAYRCDESGNPTRIPAYYAYGTPFVLPRVPIDYSNPEVWQYALDKNLAALADGASGISIDDILFTNFQEVCGTYDKLGNWKSLGYPLGKLETNAKLQKDILDFLKFTHDNVKAVYPDRKITVNYSPSNYKVGAKVDLFLPYVDGVLDEMGITKGGVGNATDEDWQNTIDAAETLSANNKMYYMNAFAQLSVNPVYPLPADRHQAVMNWTLANYLLIKGSKTYVSVARLNTYYEPLPEYDIPIGRPTSARYAAQGVQMREYTGGLTLVNPSSTQTMTVSLAKQYKDMYGKVLGESITLGPGTGVVLLTVAQTTTEAPVKMLSKTGIGVHGAFVVGGGAIVLGGGALVYYRSRQKRGMQF